MSDHLIIANRPFRSRLLIGTGKYPTNQTMAAAHDDSHMNESVSRYLRAFPVLSK